MPLTPHTLITMFFSSMDPSWQQLLKSSSALLDQIELQLKSETDLTPKPNQVMRALSKPVDQVKVLVIGQDPYPTAKVACGLAFAVSEGTKAPQSLKNLMKELASDIPGTSNGGDLVRWADQGVLLLNSALTTRVGHPGAHAKLWGGFTKEVLMALDTFLAGRLVCLSLGEHAKKLSQNIVTGEVIQATHPSPLSAARGFFGSKIYSRVNDALSARSIAPIDWSC